MLGNMIIWLDKAREHAEAKKFDPAVYLTMRLAPGGGDWQPHELVMHVTRRDRRGRALGVVATLPVLASSELATGRLVKPFEQQVPLRSAYYLVSAPAAAERAVVSAFRAWLREQAQAG